MRGAEDHTGASGARLETPWRWRSRAASLAGHERTACSNVLGQRLQRGHMVGAPFSYHEGLPARYDLPTLI